MDDEKHPRADVEISPITGSDDVRVHGLSAADVSARLGFDGDLEVRQVDPPLEHERAEDILSERELDVLRLIAAGKSNVEVADAVFLTINTVKSHIRTAYRKMGVTTRSQAVLWAVQHGLVDPTEVRPAVLDED